MLRLRKLIRSPAGETVYLGPQGANYYFTKNGEKKYLSYDKKKGNI